MNKWLGEPDTTVHTDRKGDWLRAGVTWMLLARGHPEPGLIQSLLPSWSVAHHQLQPPWLHHGCSVDTGAANTCAVLWPMCGGHPGGPAKRLWSGTCCEQGAYGWTWQQITLKELGKEYVAPLTLDFFDSTQKLDEWVFMMFKLHLIYWFWSVTIEVAVFIWKHVKPLLLRLLL